MTSPLPSAALVLVAAGTGARLGAGVNKALVELGGRPLVVHALDRLAALAWLDPLVLVGHPGDLPALRSLGRSGAGASRDVVVVAGGVRRQDSVAAGLAALPASADVVLVHDAARPFVPIGPLPDLARAAAASGAAILAAPVRDTIKEADASDPSRVGRTLPRDRLRAAQTPQAFRTADLAARLAAAERAGTSVTDEAALFEAAGLPVRFVEGSSLNFKVTTPDDLALAQALVGMQEPHAP